MNPEDQTETLSAQDEADLSKIGISTGPTDRAIVTIWRSLFGNVDTVAAQPLPIGQALAFVQRWPFLKVQDTALLHVAYHHILGACRDIIEEVAVDFPDADAWTGDDDAEHNHALYRDIICRWNIYLDQLEKNWRAEAEDAQVWLAAIPEARAALFSASGWVGHLDVIGFQISEEEFHTRLAELAAEQEVKGE